MITIHILTMQVFGCQLNLGLILDIVELEMQEEQTSKLMFIQVLIN